MLGSGNSTRPRSQLGEEGSGDAGGETADGEWAGGPGVLPQSPGMLQVLAGSSVPVDVLTHALWSAQCGGCWQHNWPQVQRMGAEEKVKGWSGRGWWGRPLFGVVPGPGLGELASNGAKALSREEVGMSGSSKESVAPNVAKMRGSLGWGKALWYSAYPACGASIPSTTDKKSRGDS